MDPTMGVVGSLVIARWSYGLLRDSSSVLLDGGVTADATRSVRAALESDGDTVAADLHIWKVGPLDNAAAIAVVADRPKTPEEYRRRITEVMPSLTHVTVEVNRCA
jgi:Co/Zn/Cd efflux system component